MNRWLAGSLCLMIGCGAPSEFLVEDDRNDRGTLLTDVAIDLNDATDVADAGHDVELPRDVAPVDVPEVADASPSARCARITSCAACLAVPLDASGRGCGWCGASGACLYGDRDGVFVGLCEGGWRGAGTTCP